MSLPLDREGYPLFSWARVLTRAAGAAILAGAIGIAGCSGGAATSTPLGSLLPTPTPVPPLTASGSVPLPTSASTVALPAVTGEPVASLAIGAGAPAGVNITATTSTVAPSGAVAPSSVKRAAEAIAGAVPFYWVTFTVSTSVSASYFSGESVTLTAVDPTTASYYAEYDDITQSPGTKIASFGPATVANGVATIANSGVTPPTLLPSHTYLLQFYYIPAGTATPTPAPSGSASAAPSVSPGASSSPSAAPSAGASASPSAAPSGTASSSPSAAPSSGASSSPSSAPSASPSPTPAPSATPSAVATSSVTGANLISGNVPLPTLLNTYTGTLTAYGFYDTMGGSSDTFTVTYANYAVTSGITSAPTPPPGSGNVYAAVAFVATSATSPLFNSGTAQTMTITVPTAANKSVTVREWEIGVSPLCIGSTGGATFAVTGSSTGSLTFPTPLQQNTNPSGTTCSTGDSNINPFGVGGGAYILITDT
jgi:hypothetical protein